MDDLERDRLELERRKHVDDVNLAQARLELERRQAGRYSGGAVTIIGAVIAVVSAVLTTTIGGYFGLRSSADNNVTQMRIKEKEVDGQLKIKTQEVEGQIAVQNLIATAERDRLEIEQKFEIIVQATKGLSPEVASENLLFFVDAGILPDPEGKIRGLAEQGRAPDLPDPVATAAVNPLLSRVAELEPAAAAAPAERAFRIENGILLGGGDRTVDHLPTPNFSASNTPKYALINFTASVGDGARRWLTNPRAKASAHLFIARSGAVTQLLPFDYAGWHAGRSQWGSLSGLNRYSIGILLENAGKLEGGAGQWQTWTGQTVPDAEVVVATHSNETDAAGCHVYTDAQILALTDILKAFAEANPAFVDILGHDDVSPGRKLDPGPAFPMDVVRQAVFGRTQALPPP